MNVSILNIFIIFFKVGALLLGGGYVILPLLTSELVEKRSWLTQENLIDYYALSQCLPGIIAVNTAIFTGYKLRGKFGALAAVVGMCASPFIVIIFLATILSYLIALPVVQNIFWGVGIGILIMLLLTIKEIWGKSIVDRFTFFVFLLILLLTILVDFSPVYSIILAALSGVIFKLYKRKGRE